MLKNNCLCDLCRSVWGEPARKEGQDKLTHIEAAIRASFEVTPLPLLYSTKDIAEALYENN